MSAVSISSACGGLYGIYNYFDVTDSLKKYYLDAKPGISPMDAQILASNTPPAILYLSLGMACLVMAGVVAYYAFKYPKESKNDNKN